TAADGSYAMQTPAGNAQLTVARANYETATSAVSVAAGEAKVQGASLRTARVAASAAALTVVAPANQSRTRQLTLSNTGALGTDVTVTELAADGTPTDVGWLTLTGATGSLASGGQHSVGLGFSTTGLTGGTYHQAKLKISSTSGRQPELVVPVTLVVPSYAMAVDAGATTGHGDVEGESWVGDQPYAAGGAGYLGNSAAKSTSTAVQGTDDQARFRNQREGMYEYRFDGLADGTYTIELNFAELRNQAPDKRVFDVLIEGQQVLPSLDIAGEVGSFRALTKTYTVTVTDGQLNVRFVTHKGFGLPVINALRVTNRPDLAS
ncbi:MAG TPA: malectin domain-containing carbohydrate-binding protein, partial [Micromonospora sp.]